MKRVLSLILSILMIVSLLCACSDDVGKVDDTQSTTLDTTDAAETTEAPTTEGTEETDAPETDGISITFVVTHDDGSEKEFEITTTATTLADALLQEKLVEESTESAGMYDVVDGEKASWDDGEAWWCFSKGGEMLPVGINETTIADGETYEAVFTHGFG